MIGIGTVVIIMQIDIRCSMRGAQPPSVPIWRAGERAEQVGQAPDAVCDGCPAGRVAAGSSLAISHMVLVVDGSRTNGHSPAIRSSRALD